MSTVALRAAIIVFLSVTASASPSPLEERMREVEAIRGLQFRGPVTTVTIDRADLPGRLRDQLRRDLPYSVEEFIEILENLLLVEPGREGVFDELIEMYEAQVLAYYDPETRTFYALNEPPAAIAELRGLAADAAREGVVVHELMHALQDQHYDIGRREIELRHDTDASMAYHSVLEGEATLVMLAHLIEQGGADFDTLIRQEMFDGILASTAAADMQIDGDTPRYFAESMKFPYLEGLKFVIAAYRRGGWAALDRVHANPPRTTREILHPEEYFARTFRPEPFLAQPAVPGPTLTVEHLGEFHWAYLVGAPNARGWVDDRVTIAQNAECHPTVLVETEWDSEEAAQRFYSAYVKLLDQRGIGFLSNVRGRDVSVAYGFDRKLMETFLR
jgi:hypothetical protein